MNRKYSKKPKETGQTPGENAALSAERQVSLSEMKKKNKKAAKITAITLLSVTAVLLVLYFLPYDRILDAMFPKDSAESVNEENVYFYPSDFEKNILTDSDYTSLNRYLSVKMGAETVSIFNDKDAEKYGDGPALLWRYVQALIHGDEEAYNALFSEAYLSEKGRQKKFPMQRLYDISATCYSVHTFTEEELDGAYKGVTQYRYELLYRIQRNDGSVRRDVGSDEAKPIYLEILIDENRSVAEINSISYGA